MGVRGHAAAGTVAVIEHAGGWALAIPADVTRRAEVETAVEQVRTAWGGVDLLMNTSGCARYVTGQGLHVTGGLLTR